MTDKATFRKGYVTADFLSHNYRISGEVDITVNPLADILNDALKSYVRVENVYISPIQNPADIKGHYRHGQLRKDNIALAVLYREEDGLPKRQSYGSYIGQVIHDVFLTVPGFEVRGLLAISATLDLEGVLVLSAERFIPISEAVATVSLAPDIKFQGGMILVNREYIGIFCISGKRI
ncbi:MAG: hypothetical protein M5R40_15685 [Anaerolineae bacterium]|nr:hypothetical protein [Anaerolineae bacterium]